MIGENNKNIRKEYGDYQTPSTFTDEICTYINRYFDVNPNVILEPTFGVGNFINSAINSFNKIEKIFGIEINTQYFEIAYKNYLNNILNKEKYFYNENIFNFDFNKIKVKLNKNDKLLIIGNPPWVTNTKLSKLNSSNSPIKCNLKKSNGLDAITGKGNFDIAEYIIIMLLTQFQDYNTTIAMLCKSSIAQNIIKDYKKLNLRIKNMNIVEFNAKKIFNIACDAVLLYINTGEPLVQTCDIYSLANHKKLRTIGWYNKKFVSNIENYQKYIQFDGKCPFIWRQGLKHDCSKIFELTFENNKFFNGNNRYVDIEHNYIYPLFKSSDLKKIIITKNRKSVIVTQKKVNQSTETIKTDAPKLWKYLYINSEIINNRKSIIYKNSPQFSMFGIGDYSFSKYKVAISGFYKEPIFSLINTENIAMLDDTCYFLSFDNLIYAQICTILLNSNPVKLFLKSLAFPNAKRPYTKDILMRIDLYEICKYIDYKKLMAFAQILNIKNNITKNDYSEFINVISEQNLQLNMFAT